jgi:chlorobactene glucosyltransferase
MWYVYQAVVTVILALFMVNLILNLRSLHRLGEGNWKLPRPLPLISILIPARNEESNIAACLESLRRQHYPRYEILVLDDGSTDITAAVVGDIAAADPRVRLLRGKPLPEGWAGKPFACHQLAKEARGSWLLFTDADTIHAPQMLRSALAYSHSHKLSLLSGFPLQHTISFTQRIALPIMYFILLSCCPLWWLQGSRKPKPGIAIGQFLFLSAADYWEIGGHQLVRSRIVEDVWLGFELARRGKRQGVVDLSDVVSCRMYTRSREVWQGITRWVYSAGALSPWLLGLLMVVGTALFVVPFVFIVGHFTPLIPDYGWSMLIAMQVGAILLMRILVDRRFHHSKIYSLSHPAGVSFWLLCCVNGAVKHLTGGGVRWKERSYTSKTGIN